MFTKTPKVAEPADGRRRSVDVGDFVCFVASTVEIELLNQDVNIWRVEAGDRGIELEVEVSEILQLKGQKLAVPACVLGQFVVCNDIGALLGVGHAIKADRRHLCDAECLCAASIRPWPAITPPSASINTGLVKPNSRMLFAICWICFGECVRGLRTYGLSDPTGRVSICWLLL